MLNFNKVLLTDTAATVGIGAWLGWTKMCIEPRDTVRLCWQVPPTNTSQEILMGQCGQGGQGSFLFLVGNYFSNMLE